jgi:DNA-binding beta-propeller fold protein YncE
MTIGMRRVTSNAVDIGFGDSGNIYVLCRGGLGTEVRVINWDDDNLGTIGTGKFTWPASLLVDKDENIYVSDESASKVFVFNKERELVTSWGEKGDGEGQFTRPSGMCFDADENIYISDTRNNRVQKYTKDGTFLMQFGTKGSGDGEFDMPWGIAIDELGDVYVADWRNDRIQKFTADGKFIMKFGRTGSDDGQFNRPSGVAVDKDGDIYVADWGNDRVQLFNAEGEYVEKFYGDANLSVSAKEYIMANPTTLRLREMAKLEETRRFRAPISVKVDDEYRMFVPDYGGHRIQIYKKNAIPLNEDQVAPPLRNPVLFTT